MGDEKSIKKTYSICPCLLKDKEEYICLGRDELYPLSFFIPVNFEIDLPLKEENTCLDMVYSDSSGRICCGSTGLPIKVKGKLIFDEVFSELYRLATSLFNPEDICRECMYNLLSFEKINRKLIFLLFTSGNPHCKEFEKSFKETVDNLQVCEEDSIVKMKFSGKIKETFKDRIKELPTVYIIDEKRKIGEIVGATGKDELEKILRKILGLKTT
ncbi:MAG: hypothetical protein WED07_12635 [Candidatus Freyarchaeum deiterrae]